MPALFFPNPDALRLALAAGIVPTEVARQRIRAGLDGNGRAWVEQPEELTRDAVAGLQRIGVQFLSPGTVPPTKVFDCWAELLSLRPFEKPPLGRVLLELPDQELARVSAEVVRIRPQQIRTRLLAEDSAKGRAWLLTSEPPTFTLTSHNPAIEAFVEQAPRVWVRLGWRHPLDNKIPIREGTLALVRPPGKWTFYPDETFAPERDLFPLTGSTLASITSRALQLGENLHLLPARNSAGAIPSMWVFSSSEFDSLLELARGTDERVLLLFDVAEVRSPSGEKAVILRAEPGRSTPAVLPDSHAWVLEHELPPIYIPLGSRLRPTIHSAVLARTLGATPDLVTWVSPGSGTRFDIHHVPRTAFHRLDSRIQYLVPDPAPMLAQTDRFCLVLPSFTLEQDPKQEVPFPPRVVVPKVAPVPELVPEPGWLTRNLRRMLAAIPRRRKRGSRKKRQNLIPVTTPGRAGEKLSSPEILLLGNEWAARRSALENRVLTEVPGLSPSQRAEVWADLAEVYTAVGNPADAAVCWTNAIWERDAAPSAWLGNWLKAETRAARMGPDRPTLEELLETRTVQCARVAAAYLSWASTISTQAPDLSPHLLSLVDLVRSHETDLPARSVWLAHGAAARLSEGDPLALARCRDRLFRRLLDAGPGLDLDAPSFLRFQGTAGGDRSQSAREWLARLRDPVRRWVDRLNGPGRLQWAGLDAEPTCTAGYADLMLAWGMSKLGDRSRAKDLEIAAIEQIESAASPDANPLVHRILVACFRDRIRSAQDGRAAAPGFPAGPDRELNQLDHLGRYAVDRLRACSKILEPVDRVLPFRGLELREFLGTDSLGLQLAALLVDTQVSVDLVRDLLAGRIGEPAVTWLPRTVLVLLEIAPRLDAAIVTELLSWVPRALSQTGDWVRTSVPGADRGPGGVARYEARILASAAHAAALYHLPGPMTQIIAHLRLTCASGGSASRRALEAVAGEFFRSVRTLGLVMEARDLLAALDGGTGEHPVAQVVPPGPLDLGLAVGWFAVGNADAGMRILDGARDRLYSRSIPDERERTAVALGYAAALGHAPTGVALGRLEELFLRLDSIDVRGAANRYFTAQPLELVDTVIRSVVSDDFAIGPGVRGWLDDDEFLIRRRINRDLSIAMQG